MPKTWWPERPKSEPKAKVKAKPVHKAKQSLSGRVKSRP